LLLVPLIARQFATDGCCNFTDIPELNPKLHMDSEISPLLDDFPILDLSEDTLSQTRKELNEMSKAAAAENDGFGHIHIEDMHLLGPDADQSLRIRIYSNESGSKPKPAVLWIHGGGYILGCPEMDELMLCQMVDDVDCTVVSVDYRLAPENPYPAALDDCDFTLRWLIENTGSLKIDPRRVAIGGASAGAGLAAALALRCRDRADQSISYQCLIYPMLDHRTSRNSVQGAAGHSVWSTENNEFAWNAYLNGNSAHRDTSAYESAACANSLNELPATYLSVGDCDLFFDENMDYAQRLKSGGVPLELHVVPGAPHGFDLFPIRIAKDEFARRNTALAKHFGRCDDG
jgi:acetyl esterase/lipase